MGLIRITSINPCRDSLDSSLAAIPISSRSDEHAAGRLRAVMDDGIRLLMGYWLLILRNDIEAARFAHIHRHANATPSLQVVTLCALVAVSVRISVALAVILITLCVTSYFTGRFINARIRDMQARIFVNLT